MEEKIFDLLFNDYLTGLHNNILFSNYVQEKKGQIIKILDNIIKDAQQDEKNNLEEE